jgi:hypothetical protein
LTKVLSHGAFQSRSIKVQVDSTVADHKVDLIVQIKDETSPVKQQYKINKVVCFTNYAINLIRSQSKRQCRAVQRFYK